MSNSGVECAVILIGIAFVIFISGAVCGYQEVGEIKSQCESSMPRDQHCKIIAIPPSHTDIQYRIK